MCGWPSAAGASSSPNVTAVASIPELKGAISINFIDDTMFVSTVHGVYSFDVKHPAKPTLLGALPMYIWENEDVDVDPVRKRLFVSRDPRGFTSPAVPGDVFPYGAVHIIDVADPAAMKQLNVFLVPAGHTTTCVNHCDTIWTAGPYANAASNPGFAGRPIYATDVTDPANPKPCPDPIDTGHNDGVTDYVHDVQVDAAGVAWVTGAGGVRGFWTSGDHLNPLTGKTEAATGCKPIPYAGSGTPESATPSRFMHNSWRDWTPPPPAVKAKKQPTKKKTKAKRKKRKRKARAHKSAAAGLDRNDVLLATEENTVTDCASSGRFVTYDLRGTYDGEGFRDTDETHHRMTVLDTWTPKDQPGATGCDSSHYFTSRGDGITANAFYTQGVRFLDTSDPTNIRQVGYFVDVDSNTWAAYWHKGYVYVADLQRGIDVLHFEGSPGTAPAVASPTVKNKQSIRFDRHVFGGLCPLRPVDF
ncbi:MAG: hypothetical protein QOJ29_3093 [Thermoleophilaceae bacterium]|nr:hypothetical protein [Thermoleophilaceae bacterium]